jgi:DNA-binding transcriptional MerR regulator/methylmalonyl-CoA mutase cobalamin-binding subunit
MNTEPRYRIHAVAEMTGVPAPTLRAWERRYGIPRPGRSESSYRLYSDADVAEVRQLLVLQTRGLAPSEAARLLLEGGNVPADVAPPTPVVSGAGREAFETARARVLDAVMAYDQGGIEREVRASLYLGPPGQVFAEVVAPVLHEVGARWERGELDVAGEHLASRIVSATLADLTSTLTRASSGAPVLLACVAEDQHDLPLYGVALAVLEAGYRPVILGQRTPPEAIAVAVSRLDPHVIGLSMTVELPEHIDPPGLFRHYDAAAAGRPWYVGGNAASTYGEDIRQAGGEVIQDVLSLRRKLDSQHRKAH